MGWISIRVSGPAGATATISEFAPTGPEAVATVTVGPTGTADLERAVPWRCDRATRRFAATLVAGDGTQQSASGEVRTPTCRGRLTVALRPIHPRARRPATVQVIDRWRLGAVATRICAERPGGIGQRCRTVQLGAGETHAAFRFHPPRAGRYPISVKGPAPFAARRVLVVRPASQRGAAPSLPPATR